MRKNLKLLIAIIVLITNVSLLGSGLSIIKSSSSTQEAKEAAAASLTGRDKEQAIQFLNARTTNKINSAGVLAQIPEKRREAIGKLLELLVKAKKENKEEKIKDAQGILGRLIDQHPREVVDILLSTRDTPYPKNQVQDYPTTERNEARYVIARFLNTTTSLNQKIVFNTLISARYGVDPVKKSLAILKLEPIGNFMPGFTGIFWREVKQVITDLESEAGNLESASKREEQTSKILIWAAETVEKDGVEFVNHQDTFIREYYKELCNKILVIFNKDTGGSVHRKMSEKTKKRVEERKERVDETRKRVQEFVENRKVPGRTTLWK